MSLKLTLAGTRKFPEEPSGLKLRLLAQRVAANVTDPGRPGTIFQSSRLLICPKSPCGMVEEQLTAATADTNTISLHPCPVRPAAQAPSRLPLLSCHLVEHRVAVALHMPLG